MRTTDATRNGPVPRVCSASADSAAALMPGTEATGTVSRGGSPPSSEAMSCARTGSGPAGCAAAEAQVSITQQLLTVQSHSPVLMTLALHVGWEIMLPFLARRY